MTRKIIWLIVLIMIISLSISVNYTNVHAADTVDDVMSGAKVFLDKGQDVVIKGEKLQMTSNFIYNLLLAIAIVVAVIVGMILGIQFMMAGIDEKAKLKETLIPYVVGCVVVFGAFGVWKLAVTILSKW